MCTRLLSAVCVSWMIMSSSDLGAQTDQQVYRTAPPAADKGDSAGVTYFYKNPSRARVAGILRWMNTVTGPDKRNDAPMVGFMAAVFARFPADIDTMIPKGLSPHMMQLVAISLQLAGQDAKAQSIAEHLKASGGTAPNLSLVPENLDSVPVKGGSDFDLLWGASFATGDPRYCLMILQRVATVANSDDNAQDILAIFQGREKPGDTSSLVEKRGNDKTVELIMVGVGIWSLNSNARQHQFVQRAVDDYIAAHPTEPVSKLLQSKAACQFRPC